MSELGEGLLLLNKPKGITSFDAVQKVRRLFKTRAVGHTGTLDPMAEGLLVLCLGRATRIAQYIEAEKKTYFGELCFGRSTDSQDSLGNTIEEVSLDSLKIEFEEKKIPLSLEGNGIDLWKERLKTLQGKIQQRVPMYSAVHVQGERLYEKARRGECIETPVREVHIHRLELQAFQFPFLRFVAEVSKGTYIRTLATDMASLFSVPGHLSFLRRISVGPYSVEDAATLEGIEQQNFEDRFSQLISLHNALPHFRAMIVKEESILKVHHGQFLGPEDFESFMPPQKLGELLTWESSSRRLLAIVECTNTTMSGGQGLWFKYKAVFH